MEVPPDQGVDSHVVREDVLRTRDPHPAESCYTGHDEVLTVLHFLSKASYQIVAVDVIGMSKALFS